MLLVKNNNYLVPCIDEKQDGVFYSGASSTTPQNNQNTSPHHHTAPLIMINFRIFKTSTPVSYETYSLFVSDCRFEKHAEMHGWEGILIDEILQQFKI